MASEVADKAAIRAQYEAWPYPQVPLLASLPSTHPWELHTAWLWDRCGSGTAPSRPRIWVAGCGTFQPYVFGLANPRACVIATDLSERSLHVARTRCRLRRMDHVQFAWADLDDPSSWPEGRFDLIECYGVLMNLRDPARALQQLGTRLAPGGVLRLMVYPQFSRTRIFQLQRVARLLGLHGGDRRHPRLLRAMVKSLPRRHPLRHAFTSYADARNDAGVVDGFLHAGDRGFTGWQLGALFRQAGLRPAFWFHRPHAQPDVMAERLGLRGRPPESVLAYLDLWQELRTNFVVCLKRTDAPVAERAAEGAHPMFQSDHGGLRHRLRLLRLAVLGGRLPCRTGTGDVRLSPADARALLRSEPGNVATRPLLLGGHAEATASDQGALFHREAELLAAEVVRDRRAPNPFYSHLFTAFRAARDFPDLGLPDLETQCARWGPWADPLERQGLPFGLTPYGTLQRLRRSVLEHLERRELETVPDLGAVRLRNEASAFASVRAFLESHDVVPVRVLSDPELRELWLLLFSYQDLFLRLD